MAGAENRLVEVAGHWLPRIEVAGIPSSAARSVMDAAGSWENWCRAWSAEGDRHKAIGEAAEAAGRLVTAGEAYARAALFYHFAQFMFFDDLRQKAIAAAAKVATYLRAAPLLDPPAHPIDVAFEGGTLKAFLRRPHRHGPHHLVILVPGSDSTKEEFPALETHFLKRGLATLSVDGPGQGEGRTFGPLRADIGPALAAVADHVRGLAGLSGRLALAGMAFGGHLVLKGAAAVPDLRGVASINGFHDLGAMWPAFPPVYRDNMCYGLGARTAEAAHAAASAFTLSGFPAPDCPVLVLHGGQDRIFPPDEAERAAAWSGAAAKIVVFAEGNHVCNNIPWLYRPMVADWIAERLAA